MKRIIRMIIPLILIFIMLFGMSVFAQEPAAGQGTLPDRISIVLFGLSGDNEGLDTNRTDSIIVVTIDNQYKQLKLTSVLRDLKADIEGHEPQKINAAYRYGGAELALKTLNQDFGLNLSEYITVDWGPFCDIINAFGGVDISLTPEETQYLNEDPVIAEIAGTRFTEGLFHLWGVEALEYCRIRKIDSDVQRSARQRKVLKELRDKAMAMNAVDFANLAKSCLDVVTETSLTPSEVMTLVSIPYGEYAIINNHFPDADLDGYVEGGIDEHGEWVWWADFGIMSERFNDIVNNEQLPQN